MRWPLLGDIPNLFKDVPGEFARLYKKYGNCAPFYMGSEKGLVISDPDDAKRLLLAPDGHVRKSRYTRIMSVVFGESVLIAEGENWERQRNYLNKLFSPKAVKRHIPIIFDETSILCDRVLQIGAHADFEACKESRLLIQRIMGRILFGELFPREKLDSLMADLQTVNDGLFGEFIRSSVLRGPLELFPLPGSRRLNQAINSISNFIDELIASDIPTDDQSLAAEIIRSTPDHDNRRSEIKDQITVIFYAGQDTTARALAWTFLYLCDNPNWALKIRNEARRAAVEHPEQLDLTSLETTLNVIREVLRLRPVAYAIDRELVNDNVLDHRDAQPGVITPIAVTNIHRHPEHWTEPEQFDPNRFDIANSTGRHQCAHIPFGHGRRKCIGASLAELELTLIIAIFCSRFNFARADKAPIRAKASVTLAPHREFGMKLTAAS